jgi:hypothetical protein
MNANETTHEISACYYPGKGEAELTFRDIETNEFVAMLVKVPEKIGDQLSKVVPCCVYWNAKNIKGAASKRP